MNCMILSGAVVFKDNNQYQSFDTFLKFITGLVPFFQKLIVCLPVTEKFGEKAPHINELKLAEVRPTYPVSSVIDFYKRLPFVVIRNINIFRKALSESDVVFLRLPTPNAYLLFLLAKLYKKEIVIYLVGDEEEVVATGKKYVGYRRTVALLIAKLDSLLLRNMIKQSVVSFFLGSPLKRKYGNNVRNGYLSFTSLIRDGDIVDRKDTCYKTSINLLYIGRLSHEKGLAYLIQAVGKLKDEFNIKLRICGGNTLKKYKKTETCLKDLREKLTLQDSIEFIDFVPPGKQLNRIFMESDIFVLPSLSEGIPKVLLEAMAKGLPIIATNVGGIPDIIKQMENGILVPPRSPEAVAEAVKLVINNDSLRKQIIENGYRFVKEHTAEKQAQMIAKIIYKHIGK